MRFLLSKLRIFLFFPIPYLSQPLSGFDKVWNSFSDLRSMTPLSVIFTQEEQPEIVTKKEKVRAVNTASRLIFFYLDSRRYA